MKTKWLNKTILGFGLTSFFNDFSHEMTTAILPTYISLIFGNINAPWILGIISGISNCAATISKLFSGFLTNRLQNYKPILIFGYSITPIFVALIGTTKSLWQIIFYKTVAWTGKGLREPMRDTWISNIIPEKYYGHAFGFTRALDTFGAILGPLIAYFLIKLYSLETIFFISFIPGFFSILSIIFLTQKYKIINIKNINNNILESIKNLPTNFIYFSIIMLIFSFANFNKLLIIYRAQEVFSGKYQSSIIASSISILLYTFFNIIRAFSEYLIGSLSDYIDRKFLLAIFGFGFFCLTSISLIFSINLIWFWVIIFLLSGISTGTITSLEKSYAAQILPENLRGIGFGLLQSITGLGDLISSITVGTLWSLISPIYGFIYAAILSFISFILLFNLKNK